MPIFDLRTWIMIGLGIALAGALSLAGVQTMRLSGEQAAHSETKRKNAETLTAIANLATKAAEAAVAAQQAGQVAAAAIDSARTKEKTDALKKIAALRADVAAGKRRLHVAATCPAARGGDVPASTSAASVADAAGPELTPDAKSAYFDISGEITTMQSQIGGLQDYIRDVCKPYSQDRSP